MGVHSGDRPGFGAAIFRQADKQKLIVYQVPHEGTSQSPNIPLIEHPVILQVRVSNVKLITARRTEEAARRVAGRQAGRVTEEQLVVVLNITYIQGVPCEFYLEYQL